MSRLIFVELFKLRRRLMTQILALLVVAFFVFIQVPRWHDQTRPSIEGGSQAVPVEEVGPDGETRGFIVERPKPADRSPEEEDALRREFLESTFDDNLAAARWIAVLFGIVLTAAALGSEYSWGTLRPFLTCVESRMKYLGAKLAALGIVVLAGMAAAMALGIATSILVAAMDGGADLGFVDGGYLQDAFFDFWRTAYSVSPYLLLTALGAIIGRSALTGAFVGLGLLIADSIATGVMQGSTTWLRHVPDYLPGHNVDALVGVRFEDVASRDPWAAAFVLAAYAFGALAITLWVFNRRDVTA
jgi:ABC-type transport system involved in multi-copper enzyme maturation permease subunit